MPSLPDIANAIANHPEVLARVAPGFDALDIRPFFGKPENVFCGGADGMALFAYVEPGVYEGHFLFPPGTPDKFHHCRLFIAWLFTYGGAARIKGQVPADNLPARAMTRALGFTRQGISVSPSGRSCVDYTLERDTWAILSEASLAG